MGYQWTEEKPYAWVGDQSKVNEVRDEARRKEALLRRLRASLRHYPEIIDAIMAMRIECDEVAVRCRTQVIEFVAAQIAEAKELIAEMS